MDPAREALIRQIYRDQLGRDEVDDPGLNYWMNSSLSNDQLSGAIGYAAKQPTVNETPRPATNNYSAELMQDAGYNAWLRAAGVEESELQSRYIAAQDAIMRRMDAQKWGFKDQQRQQLRNIGENYAGRGMYRSGRRLQAQGEAETTGNYNYLMNRGGQTDRLSSMASDQAMSVAGIRREGGEQNLATRNRLTQGSLLI